MIRLVSGLKVRGVIIETDIQCMIVSSHLQNIDKCEIATWVSDWVGCTLKLAVRIVDSVIGVCIRRVKV